MEDCAIFSSRYYSWGVGKERWRLSFLGSTRCLARSSLRPSLPSEVRYYLSKIWRTFQFREHWGLHHWTKSRCLSSLSIGRRKINGKIPFVQCSKWGLKFFWLRHSDIQTDFLGIISICNIFNGAGLFRVLDLWILGVQPFLTFNAQIAIHHQVFQDCFSRPLMWSIRGEFWIRLKNILKVENWIADDISCEAFLFFCSNTTLISCFELVFVDPSVKLNV